MIVRRIVAVIALSFIGCVTCQAEGSTNAVHLSRQAYPNAVVSTNDPISSITIAVEPNGEELKAVNRTGEILWKVNLVDKWGKPSVGTAVIRHLSIRGEKIQVTIGKHMYGEVDIKTGKDQFKGED